MLFYIKVLLERKAVASPYKNVAKYFLKSHLNFFVLTKGG